MPRAPFHDYKRPSSYHITISKRSLSPYWGELTGVLPGVWIRRSAIGDIIARKIYQMPGLSPSLKMWQYIVMPDHLHFLVNVCAPLPRHLGHYISMFKNAVIQEARVNHGIDCPIFKEDYHDRIIYPGKSIQTVFDYIRANPYRLGVRIACPENFRRINRISIGGTEVMAYGNIQLLDNPFKGQVVVHRRDTETEHEANKARWLHIAANGGVLVSPFISSAEKGVRAVAEEAGGKIILITNTPFGERFKPAEHDFNLCAEGRLLLLAPLEPRVLSRAECLFMNSLAAKIAGL